MRFLKYSVLLLSLSACELLPAERIKENDKFSLMVDDGVGVVRVQYDLNMTDCHTELSEANETAPKDGQYKSKWYCERQPDGQLM